MTVRLRYPMSHVLIRRRSDFYPVLITVTGALAGLVLIAGILCAEGFTRADRLRGIFGTVQDAVLRDGERHGDGLAVIGRGYGRAVVLPTRGSRSVRNVGLENFRIRSREDADQRIRGIESRGRRDRVCPGTCGSRIIVGGEIAGLSLGQGDFVAI